MSTSKPADIQSAPQVARPRGMSPTVSPRAHVTRLLIGVVAALLLASGPAVAWDMTTQPPRAAARSPWPAPHPWTGAGKVMKKAAKGMSAIYLPQRATEPEPDDSASVPSAPPLPTASVAIRVLAPPAYSATPDPVFMTLE